MSAVRAQAAQPAQLCDYCHQKPKFGGHQYCSKTCASQAATLCNHCHKKPKFQNFDYCGKHCASLAAANGTKPRGAAANGTTVKKGTNINNNQQPAAGGNTIDPMQIAQIVVQHVPQLQSLLASAQGQGSGSSASANVQPGGTQPPSNNPFLNAVNTVGAAVQGTQSTNGSRSIPFFSRGKKNAQPPLNVSTKQAPDDLRCLIPGCKQPVHVDEEGIVSDYCSLRHREQAVTSGLASPCIMCLVLPQTDSDYFCSKACRDESMNKQYDDGEEEEEWDPVESQKP
ncbi:hypothetical protein P691DRAFT_778244 [Macrolepiota fuliginosa MF-IS2]|uniref:Uncharacterized protein n=1 Tax=Macrolepiota fuliginosa MF-IS2 TaxID=1400762 RepID=A0A9P5X5K6_9AGAR|nr:hypothetical protein P691DRAFT_778244 [Macrolepiota fuliginosa MF-IS2]